VGLRLVERLDGDLPEQLHRLYLAEWWTHRRNLDDVRRMLEGSDVVLGLVDEDTGALAGFARVITDFVFKALVLDVIVEAGCRGTGLAARLHDAFLAEVRDRGYRTARLHTPAGHARARRFYERRGWRVSAPPETWLDLAVIEYRCPVPS